MVGWQFAVGAAAAAVGATVFAFVSHAGGSRSRGLSLLSAACLAAALVLQGWGLAAVQQHVEAERSRQLAEQSVATQRISGILKEELARVQKRLTELDPQWEQRQQEDATPASASTAPRSPETPVAPGKTDP